MVALVDGCASIGSIKTNYASINYTDGIDQKEAVLIAKEHLINTDYRYCYRVIGPQIEDRANEGMWLVRFYGKKTSISEWYMPSVYEVSVDKKTGACKVEYINNVSPATSLRD